MSRGLMLRIATAVATVGITLAGLQSDAQAWGHRGWSYGCYGCGYYSSCSYGGCYSGCSTCTTACDSCYSPCYTACRVRRCWSPCYTACLPTTTCVTNGCATGACETPAAPAVPAPATPPPAPPAAK